MTYAIVALAIATVAIAGTAIGAVLWAVKRCDKYIDLLFVANDRSVKQTLAASSEKVRADRADFEREKAQIALDGERARANAMTEFISHYAGTKDANADLAPDDVDGRVLRIAQSWAAANGRASSAGTAGDVHHTATAGAPAAHVQRSDVDLMRPED